MAKTLTNGCTTVNCGEVRTVNGLEVEVLSPTISKHGANIVCAYHVAPDGHKVELTYFEDGDNKGHEVYHFERPTDVHHYKSFLYRESTLPKIYKDRAEQLRKIHAEVFVKA